MIENCSVVWGNSVRDTILEILLVRSISVISLISTDAVCGMCYGGEGGTSLYKPFRYVLPQRVFRFLRRFGLESGIVVRGATVVYEHIFRLVLNE